MSATPTAQPKPKKIKAVVGLDKMADGNVTAVLDGSLKGLTDHATIFPKPPVDLATYEAAINAYKVAIPATLDGSRTAIAQKNKLRHAAVKIYAEMAHYVEANCNDDMATFLLSGFQPANTTKAPPQPLPTPAIASLVQGPITGQLKFKIDPAAEGLTFQVRYAQLPTGNATPNWTEQMVPTKKPFIFTNLTPGTVYTFQVRALGRLGFTDWSDPVNRMVT